MQAGIGGDVEVWVTLLNGLMLGVQVKLSLKLSFTQWMLPSDH